jgi:protein TonB
MRLKGTLTLLMVVALTGGCAASLKTPAGRPISSVAYNKAMADRGETCYCGAGNCDIPPTLIHAIAPRYPAAALAEGRAGLVSVLFDIEATGEVSNIRLVSTTSPEFGEAAIEAISTWKYKPAKLKGNPVKVGPLRQNIPFQLHR